MLRSVGNIEFCTHDSIAEVVEFLRVNWQHDHPFVLCRELLDWQHLDSISNTYGFLLHRNCCLNIDGVLGFLRGYQFDPTLEPKDDVLWLAIWKSSPDAPVGVGYSLLRKLLEYWNGYSIGVVNIGRESFPLYRRNGFTVDTLDRYVLINHSLTNAALVTHRSMLPKIQGRSSPTLNIEHIAGQGSPEQLTQVANLPQSPRKTRDYLANRYFRHPYYAYEGWVISFRGRVALLIGRYAEHDGKRALRLVDVVGDLQLLAESNRFFTDLMEEQTLDFIDFYCYGLRRYLDQAQFIRLGEQDFTVAASRFEPFELVNRDIHFAIRGQPSDFVLVKGDGDGDRPHRLCDR